MKFSRFVTLSVILAVLTLPASAHKGNRGPNQGKQKGASFEALLVRAADVNTPATLLTIAGTDPLKSGSASLTARGHIQVKLIGSLPNTIYDVIYLSLNGTSERTLGSLSTNPAGNANFELQNLFVLNDAGAGSILLRRNALNQYITGFQRIAARTDREDEGEDDEEENPRFEGDLVRCAEVNQPVALQNSGADPLGKGEAKIDLLNGSVKVEVEGAAPNARYDVVFRLFDASSEMALAALTTDNGGKGEIELPSFFSSTAVGAGNIVLTRESKDQFVTGFKIVNKSHGRHGHRN